MKKMLFLPFFILGLFIAEPATAKNSTSTKADFNGHMQSPDDDEYMFLTESVFNTVKTGYDSGKKEIYADVYQRDTCWPAQPLMNKNAMAAIRMEWTHGWSLVKKTTNVKNKI